MISFEEVDLFDTMCARSGLRCRINFEWSVVHVGIGDKIVRLEKLESRWWIVTFWADTSDASFELYRKIPFDLICEFFE